MNGRLRPMVLFVLAAVLTGGVYVATKAGLAYIPPVLFASLRFGFAALLLLSYVRATTSNWYPSTLGDWLAVLTAGGLIIAAANALLFVGQQFVSSATAAILVSINPVLTAVFAVALLPQNGFSVRRFVGLLTGLVGIGAVARPDSPTLLKPSVTGAGLIITAAVALALGSVLLRRVTATLSTLAITGWATAVGGLMLFGISIILGESPAAIDWTQTAIVVLAALLKSSASDIF